MSDFLRIKFRSLVATTRRLTRSQHFRFGIPFLTLMVGTAFALPIVTNARFEFARIKPLTKDQIKEINESGIQITDESGPTLEELHEEYMKKDYSTDYDMVRLSRPWEEEGEHDRKREACPIILKPTDPRVINFKSRTIKKVPKEKKPTDEVNSTEAQV